MQINKTSREAILGGTLCPYDIWHPTKPTELCSPFMVSVTLTWLAEKLAR